MQASDVFDITQEPKHIHEMYGSGVHARQLMIARQIGRAWCSLCATSGMEQVSLGDNHDEIEKGHRHLAKQCSSADCSFVKGSQTERATGGHHCNVWRGNLEETPGSGITNTRCERR